MCRHWTIIHTNLYSKFDTDLLDNSVAQIKRVTDWLVIYQERKRYRVFTISKAYDAAFFDFVQSVDKLGGLGLSPRRGGEQEYEAE